MDISLTDIILKITPGGVIGIHTLFLRLLITKRDELDPIDARLSRSFNLPIWVIGFFLICNILILLLVIVGPIFLDWIKDPIILKLIVVSLGTAIITTVWSLIKLRK